MRKNSSSPFRARRFASGLRRWAATWLLLAVALFPATGAELEVRGLGWLNNRAAAQKLKVLRSDQLGQPLDANALEDAALVLISTLKEQGYLAPMVEVEATLTDGSVRRKTLDPRLEPPLPRPLTATSAVLHFKPGRRFTLNEIVFTGLTAMKEKEARAFFVGESTLFPLASERIYSPTRLNSGAGNLEEALRQMGYAEAEVTPGEPRIDDESGQVRVGVAVSEGRRWIVQELRFETADGSAEPKEIGLGRMTQPWNAVWRQDTTTAIRRWYFRRGHPDVQVQLIPLTRPRRDGTSGVTVTARVTPGLEVRVGRVTFRGNERTYEGTLRRHVRVKAGALLDPAEFNDSEARISRLGVFRSVDLHYEPGTGPVRDAVFDLKEGRRQEVNLLAGYGSYEQFRGGVEWRHYNLFGRAHTDNLKLIQSMKGTSGDYTYTVPDLFVTIATGSARFFGWQREEFSFVNQEYGATLSVMWPIRPLKLNVTTGYTFRHLRDAVNELGIRSVDARTADVGSLTLDVVRDRRDNPLRPHKGYKANVQVELANRALGGQVDYQKLVFGASYHTAWGRGRWFHAGFSHGVLTTFGGPGDASLPVSVRFYPGGDGSIRGYRRGQAAPRNGAGLLVGAKAYLQGNLELEQAITPKWSVVLFGDALGTAVNLRDYPFSEKLYSAGLGVRYQTIIGPVRLEYGRNLNPRPLDPSGTLLVSIGFPF